MTLPIPSHDAGESEEQRFLRAALNRIDKAEKSQRIKTIVVTTIAFATAFAVAFRGPAPELNINTVLIGVGLIAAVCTSKIKALINTNTKAILNAIMELHQDEQHQK